MRTLRLTLVGAVVLSLLGVFGAAVVAQSEEAADEVAPVAATGTLEIVTPVPEAEPSAGSDAVAQDDATVHVHNWTSSDPRLTGTATYTGNWQLYDPPAEDCDDPDAAEGAIYEIANEGGSWRCAGVRAPIPGPDGATNVHTVVLKGTSDYEGLTTYILIDWSSSPFAFSALITPNAVPIGPVMQG